MPGYRGLRLAALVVTLSLAWSPDLAQGAVALKAEGLGTARVVGGNVVSARRRALHSAKERAIVDLAAQWLADRQAPALTAPKRALLLRHQRRLTTGYRVLEERQEGVVFFVKVELSVAARGLVRLLGEPGVAPKTGAFRVQLVRASGQGAGLAAAAGRRVVQGALAALLRERGIGLLATLGSQKNVLTVTSRWALKKLPGVRILALEGVEARVLMSGELNGRGEQVEQVEVATAAKREGAARRALAKAVRKGAARLVRRFYSVQQSGGRVSRIVIAGVDRVIDLGAICQVIRQRTGYCAPSRVRGRTVTLSAGKTTGLGGLAHLLTGFDFNGFSLALERVSPDLLRLRMRPEVAGSKQ